MLEIMSQFASKEDLYKARSERFAQALVDVMDGIKDHDIQSEIGLLEEDCLKIKEARADAYFLIHGKEYNE